MSRIGNRVLTVPENVTVTNENGQITVRGPKGELSLELNKNINVEINGNEIKVTRNSEIKTTKQMHGTTNALIANMIKGVSEGYEKALFRNGPEQRGNRHAAVLRLPGADALLDDSHRRRLCHRRRPDRPDEARAYAGLLRRGSRRPGGRRRRGEDSAQRQHPDHGRLHRHRGSD